MRVDAKDEDGPQWAREGDGRRLRVGAFMRKWNIDELPQFWNVLKGDMSLVGPRPERPEFIKDFKHSVTYYNVRHTVKPGITGWAAVNGWRGNTDLAERIRFDLELMMQCTACITLRAAQEALSVSPRPHARLG